MEKRIQQFLDFINASPSGYHAAANLAALLEAEGYCRLREQDAWQLVPGGKYYLIRGGITVLAFRIPEEAPTGFMMAAAHVDRPTFKVKENAELVGT